VKVEPTCGVCGGRPATMICSSSVRRVGERTVVARGRVDLCELCWKKVFAAMGEIVPEQRVARTLEELEKVLVGERAD
jgi:hypothetical protein